MPELIPADRSRVLSVPTPILVLSAALDGVLLPLLESYDSGAPVRVAGWSVVARTTMCVLDGPGDQGFLVPTLAEIGQMDERAAWAQAVADSGGLLVLQVGAHRLEASVYDLLADTGTRGGFVPHLG